MVKARDIRTYFDERSYIFKKYKNKIKTSNNIDVWRELVNCSESETQNYSIVVSDLLLANEIHLIKNNVQNII